MLVSVKVNVVLVLITLHEIVVKLQLFELSCYQIKLIFQLIYFAIELLLIGICILNCLEFSDCLTVEFKQFIKLQSQFINLLIGNGQLMLALFELGL